MARVLTFSRTFPGYHPKAGQPTYFVPAIWQSLYNKDDESFQGFMIQPELKDDSNTFNSPKDFYAKHHTIREGHRWKVGDWFSPRVWSGKPYNSKQIIIAPDIHVKKVFDFTINNASKELPLDYDTDIFINHKSYNHDSEIIRDLVKNDGLSVRDFFDWFQYPKPFTGQIICWNENINY